MFNNLTIIHIDKDPYHLSHLSHLFKMSQQDEHTITYTNAEYGINTTVCVSFNEFGTPIIKAAQMNGAKLTFLQTLLIEIFALRLLGRSE
jgi:hypothetical protein